MMHLTRPTGAGITEGQQKSNPEVPFLSEAKKALTRLIANKGLFRQLLMSRRAREQVIKAKLWYFLVESGGVKTFEDASIRLGKPYANGTGGGGGRSSFGGGTGWWYAWDLGEEANVSMQG